MYLLDTNALIWWLIEPARIKPSVLEVLQRPETVVYFSQISLLEIQIKVSLGKLKLGFALENLPALGEESGLSFLPLSNAAIFTLPKLPLLHRDPFDRLLICESIQTGAALVTSDEIIHKYPVRTFWL